MKQGRRGFGGRKPSRG